MLSDSPIYQIRVLLVEDNPTDAMLVRDELTHATEVVCVLTHCRRLSEAIACVGEQVFDVVLLDLMLPDSEGLSTYTKLQAVMPNVAIVVLSHLLEEELALKAVRAGAQDYLVKERSDGLLLRAMRYGIGRMEADQQLRLLEASLAQINDVVIITSADRNNAPYPRIVYVNDAFVRHTGYTREEAIGNTPAMLQGPKTQRAELDRIGAALRSWQPVQAELINYTKAGGEFWLEMSISPLKDASGWVTHWVAVERNVTERYRASQQMQETLDELQESRAQLQTLSHRVMKAQETERRRVALELHDELGQALTAVKINLMASNAAQAGGPSALQLEAVDIVEDTLQQVRSLALALRPSMLDDLGLEAALSWLVQSSSIGRDTAITLQCTMDSDRVNPDVETACFRIVQESLTNIRRHALAKNVRITLAVDQQRLDLIVEDDGVGFDMERGRDHHTEGYSSGLLGIRERALAVGGIVRIVSAPENGCTVRLTCLLNASPPSTA